MELKSTTVKLNGCPIAPRKMRLVVDSIRGERVVDALNVLKFQSKAGSPLVEKLLLSAIASWEEKNPDASLEDADLYIKEAYVCQGKTLKRFRPAPQGRAHRIRKRSNHVTLVVDALNAIELVGSEEAVEAEEVQANEEIDSDN